MLIKFSLIISSGYGKYFHSCDEYTYVSEHEEITKIVMELMKGEI
jgi:hypothetical protein